MGFLLFLMSSRWRLLVCHQSCWRDRILGKRMCHSLVGHPRLFCQCFLSLSFGTFYFFSWGIVFWERGCVTRNVVAKYPSCYLIYLFIVRTLFNFKFYLCFGTFYLFIYRWNVIWEIGCDTFDKF